MPVEFYTRLFAAFAFVFGAVVGSFLNVCIYRMPLNLSVNEPRRSFCPQCKKQIPFWLNIPLVSWLTLRARCANCGCKIPFRYFGVELLTALLFLAVWLKCWASGSWILALPYCILVSLLVVATFIDFDYFIIPDEITWGGVVAGIVLSLAIPPMMQTDSHMLSGLWSIAAAALGYGTLWLVVELGKKAFGRKRVVLDPPEKFSWKRDGEDADLTLGNETMRWSEMFSREKDRLVMECTEAEVAGVRHQKVRLEFSFNRLTVGDSVHELDQLDTVSGVASEIVIPREAMGFGDVKFIAAIGAFLGWQSVIFTVMCASFIGAIIGSAMILAGKREWSAKIPFGPYLALAALIWIFSGPQLVSWYLHLFSPAG